MPYEIRGSCVHKQGEDEPLKCYDTIEQARDYLAALEVNVDKSKSMMMLTQAETNYNAAGGQVNKACSNCRWFCPPDMGMETMCHLVMDDPAPIVANGLCDRWEMVPAPAADPTEALVEVVSEAVEVMAGATYTMEAKDEQSIIERIWQRIKERVQGEKQDSAFTVFKGTDGKYYWHAVFTNNFEDREGEILSAKAHERYEQRVNMGLVPMPELWTWHTKGTEHGLADAVWFNNHFMHAIGHFTGDEKSIEKSVQFYQKNPVKLSHGFTSPEWAIKDGVFDDYNTFEITTLPPRAAANVYTSFEDIKEMPLTEAKRQWIEAQFGKDKLAEIEAADDKRAKALDDLKVTYKDFANTTPEPTAQPTQESDKALTAVYTDLVQTQDELLNIAKAQADIIKSYEARLKAQDAQIATLAKAVNQREAPSQSLLTVTPDEIAALFKGKLPAPPDPKNDFYGGLVKTSEAV